MQPRSIRTLAARIGTVVDRAAAFGASRLEHISQRRYAAAPLCGSPLGSESDYLRAWHRVKDESYPAIDAYEQESGAAIDASWFQQVALLTQVAIKQSPLCYQHGRLLYATLREYADVRRDQQLNVVETGTARGFSALCLAKALCDAGASGKISTFDVLPHETRIYWNCLRDAEGRRTRAELLHDYRHLIEPYIVFHRGDTRLTLGKVTFPRVHFAFLDSVHTYSHVMAEFAAIRGRQQPGDILFFDDYTPDAYPGVVKAADEICELDGYSSTVIAATAQRRYLIARKA